MKIDVKTDNCSSMFLKILAWEEIIKQRDAAGKDMKGFGFE